MRKSKIIALSMEKCWKPRLQCDNCSRYTKTIFCGVWLSKFRWWLTILKVFRISSFWLCFTPESSRGMIKATLFQHFSVMIKPQKRMWAEWLPESIMELGVSAPKLKHQWLNFPQIEHWLSIVSVCYYSVKIASRSQQNEGSFQQLQHTS